MKRPNILFLFPDQWRGDWLGGMPGLALRTPNLDRLRARGTTFTNAITPSPLCAPARAIVASGLAYERCGVAGNHVNYPTGQTTVYNLLREAGYHTMGCGKFDLAKATKDWGLDGSRSLDDWGFCAGIDNEGKWDGVNSGKESPRGPYLNFLEERGLRQAHVDDFGRRRGDVTATFPTTLPDDAYCDNWLAANGLRLLAEAPKDQPWFLQVNFTGPHDPWDITESMAELYADTEFPLPMASTKWLADEHPRIRRNYAAMCTNIDRLVGEFIAAVERRGELDNTLIVFSSDHGEMLGDHDGFGKSVPFHGSVGVPLIVAGPGVREQGKCAQPTDLLDLPATFLAWAGVATPADWDSRSLGRLLREVAPPSHRPVVRSALHRWKLAFDGRYKLVRGHGDGELLFDLAADPGENRNLAASTHEAVAAARRRLAACLE